MFASGVLLCSSPFSIGSPQKSGRVPPTFLVVGDRKEPCDEAPFVAAVPFALGLVASVASIASAQTDPHVGTWKLNLAKSKCSPGPPPKSITLTYEADGPRLTLVLQGVDVGGKPINPEKKKITAVFDGKDYAFPNQLYDTMVGGALTPTVLK